MDILSTKTRAEREDEEAKRLVRPAPKVKPPRRDRRRERMNPDDESDPDEEADKRDRSENYKAIGGSLAERVAARHIFAIEFPTDEAKKQYLEEHPGADPSKHTVKEQEEEGAPKQEEKPGKSPQELADLAGQLKQLVKEDPAVKGILKQFEPGGALDFTSGPFGGNPDMALPAQVAKHLPESLRGLTMGELSKVLQTKPAAKGKKQKPQAAPPEAKAPESAAPPEAKPGQEAAPPEAPKPEVQAPKPEAEAKPEVPAAGKKAPGAKKPPKVQGPKKLVPPKRENYESDEEFKQSQENYKNQLWEQKNVPKPQRKDFGSEDEFEQALAKHKATLAQVDKDLTAILVPPEEKGKPSAPEKPTIPEPARPEASPLEKQQAREQLSEVFGDTTAAELSAAGLHPQDVSTLVDMYQAVSSKPEERISDYAAKVAEFYQTNPKKVPPPKAGENAAGDTVPFDQLTPEEQSEAYRKAQLRTVAISLAAERGVRDAVSKVLPKGTDARLAGELAAVLLQPQNEARSTWAEKAADRSYQTALQSAGEPIGPNDVKKLLETLGNNDDAKKIAVGYLQGQDFNIAKNIFLHKGAGVGGALKKGLGWVGKAVAAPAQFLWDVLVGDERDPDYEVDEEAVQKIADEYAPVSEWSSPKQIGRGVKAAQDFFDLRAKNYPENLTVERDPSQLFRQQILQRVKTLTPDKYAAVKANLEEYDFNRYDEKQASYENSIAEWEADRDLGIHQAHGREAEVPVRKKFKSDEEFEKANAAHSALKEDRQAAEWAWEQKHPKPKAPLKPVGYDRNRNPKALRDMRKWLLAEQFSQHGGKTAARVAARYVISSYLTPRSMASVSEKAAVYNGVAPYKDTSGYAPWKQPRQRDIGETDYEIILTAAREWEKTPVLKVPLVGATKDAQLRAALDLAIYESRYNGQIQPNVYNLLLGRLAGVDTNETLLTQRTQGVYSPVEQGWKVATMKASNEIRKLAAKYAAENATLAYDLMDLATRLAQDEGQQDQGQQKQAQDQQQDQGQEKQASKYASLRSAVIQAAHKNPDARTAFLPVLQAVKGLDV